MVLDSLVMQMSRLNPRPSDPGGWGSAICVSAGAPGDSDSEARLPLHNKHRSFSCCRQTPEIGEKIPRTVGKVRREKALERRALRTRPAAGDSRETESARNFLGQRVIDKRLETGRLEMELEVVS